MKGTLHSASCTALTLTETGYIVLNTDRSGISFCYASRNGVVQKRIFKPCLSPEKVILSVALGRCWCIFGPRGAYVARGGACGGIRKALGGVWEASGRHLEGIWGLLGSTLGDFLRFWVDFGSHFGGNFSYLFVVSDTF